MAFYDRIRQAYQAFRSDPPAEQRQYNNGRGYGGLTSGGIANLTTGMGTSLDKSQGNFFSPTRIYSRRPLEVLCVESWVAKKAIDILIDDMFIRWRLWESDDAGQVAAMEEAEKQANVKEALGRAMKAGDQYELALW